MNIRDLRDRDFSEYCEYVVAFKLEELGWKVFQPLSDRYIDIVAYRKINGKDVIRTIQVKGSRIELEGEKANYGLTHKPKDLMHDPRHFFIWLFYDNNYNENFIVLSVTDFIGHMGKGLKTMSWRKGNDRIHPPADIENTSLKNYINNWDNLLKGGNPDTYELCIESQEVNKVYKDKKEAVEKWKLVNSKVINSIPQDMLKRIKRKIGVEET